MTDKLEQRLVNKYFDLWEKHGFNGTLYQNCQRLGLPHKTAKEWRVGRKVPNLSVLLRELDKLGYTLDIVPKKKI